MKAVLVDTLDEGRHLEGDFKLVYVLSETFESFDRYVSLPGKLDGAEVGVRDRFLTELGALVDVELLHKEKSFLLKPLGTELVQLVSLFELNFHARFPEIWNLAKVSWLAGEIERLQGVTLQSTVRNCPYLDAYLFTRLPKGVYLGCETNRPNWVQSLRNIRSTLFSAFKGHVWLLVLARRALAARRWNPSAISGHNLVISPVTRESRKGALTWGPYWRYLSEVESEFTAPISQIFFTSGAFSDHRGERLRLQSFSSILVSLVLSQALIFSMVLREGARVVRRLVRPSRSVPEFGLLQAALRRSLVGPSFAQAYWEQLQFSHFFRHVAPVSVFFLCEGQSWERALVCQGHRLRPQSLFVGVVHNAVRPWDLRYFRPKSWGLGPVLGGRTAPDLFLLTAEVCLRRIHQYYGDCGQIKMVETLRFARHKKIETEGLNQVAVLAGTYENSTSAKLEEFVSCLDSRIFGLDFRFRGHPQASFVSKFPEFNSQNDFPVITITDSSSSLCAELAECEDPVLVLRFGHLPNLSPLADLTDFAGIFLLSGHQLGSVASTSKPQDFVVKGFNYFERNERFVRWRSLIKSYNL